MIRQFFYFVLIALFCLLAACRNQIDAYHPYQKIKERSPQLVTPALPHKTAITRKAIYRDLQKQQVTILHQQNTMFLIMPSTTNFSPQDAVVNANFRSILDNVIRLLQQYPYSEADVLGFTDNQGTPQQNKKLSLERAHAVINYLESQGVTASRLIPIAKADAKPRGDNNTAQGRFLNRRVEFFIH